MDLTNGDVKDMLGASMVKWTASESCIGLSDTNFEFCKGKYKQSNNTLIYKAKPFFTFKNK